MKEYQREFIRLSIANEVLRFGQFTLKSGRVSPFFFNAGLFCSGSALSRLGTFYASALQESGLDFDVLFGPAYKGIPLASSAAVALARDFDCNVGVTFNRKEVKAHGEGGKLVGAALKGRVVIIDDVMTAGTAIRESVAIISESPAILAGVIVALDRQETTTSNDSRSAVQAVRDELNVPVLSIVTFANLVEYLKEEGGYSQQILDMEAYRLQFGAEY